MLFVWVIVAIFAAIVLWLAYFAVLDFAVGRSRRQSDFLAGRLPTAPPSGFYRGSAYLLGPLPVPWLGKFFDPENANGFNTFTPSGGRMLHLLTPLYSGFRQNSEGNTDAYHFKTSIGPGLKDRGIETFKLDYDSPANPFLIRIILDEIVEVSPQRFLGKVHVKVFPGFFATIGYFGLGVDDRFGTK